MTAQLRKCLRIGVVLLLAAAGLYGCNALLFHGYMVQWAKLKREEVPVNIKLTIADQLGEPAQRYKIGVRIEYIAWYYWIFSPMGYSSKLFVIQTDVNGVARLHPWLRKGLRIQLEDIQPQGYIFPGNAEEAANPRFGNNLVVGFANLRDLGRDEQLIPVQVLKHGEATKVVLYAPNYPKRQGNGDGFEVEAKDENTFTIGIKESILTGGVEEGDLILRIKGAKHACQSLKEEPWWHGQPDLTDQWLMILETKRDVGVQDAGGGVPLYAPKTSYCQSMKYGLLVGEKQPKGTVRFDGELWRIGLERGFEGDCKNNVFLGGNSFERALFIRNEQDGYYGYIRVRVDLSAEGKILLRVSGFYNPDGSTNLWRGHR